MSTAPARSWSFSKSRQRFPATSLRKETGSRDSRDLRGRAALPRPALARDRPAGTIHILRQIAQSLAEAHDTGLIHRDIKPANVILICRGGIHDFVKVVDFGLVKSLDAVGDAGLTQEAMLMGTAAYVAPEVVRSPRNAGPSSDVYALGATAYYLVTGTEVFSGGSIMEICSHHLLTAPEPPSIRRPGDVPADLEAIILRCLSKDPSERPDIHGLLADLGACSSAGAWTEEDARRWWQESAPPLRESLSETMHLDLDFSATTARLETSMRPHERAGAEERSAPTGSQRPPGEPRGNGRPL